ncbi:MAG: hypothetical protein ACRCX2_30670, partial [Paraclostridium sp.]
MLLTIIFLSCTNSQSEIIQSRKFSKLTIVYNSYYNMVIGSEMHIKTLSDISMMLHEYGHVLCMFHKGPDIALKSVLNK